MATAVPPPSAVGINLPQRLLNFFTRYPPKLYSARYGRTAAPLPGARLAASQKPPIATGTPISPTIVPIASTTSSSDPNESSTVTTASIEDAQAPPAQPDSEQQEILPNPFLPYRNPATGKWRGPAYSLRRQADLVKLAKAHGIEPLLPPGKKSTAYQEQRLEILGLRVKGTGEGQKVKGHKWERNLREKLDKRRKAMEEMPTMIKLWKERGHGRGWKKYPKSA